MKVKKIKYSILDSLTMSKRCILISTRNIDTLVTGIVTPTLMMLLFVFVFGGAVDVGNLGDHTFLDYVVPGIILQCIGASAATTAISGNNDMTKGVLDRFRTMSISKSSVLTGHALAATVRNIITTVVVIGIAFLIGFRPATSFTGWLIIIGILILYILVITWLSVIFGLIRKCKLTHHTWNRMPFVSSDFVPTNSMPDAVHIFAENQPMTPIVDTGHGTIK